MITSACIFHAIGARCRGARLWIAVVNSSPRQFRRGVWSVLISREDLLQQYDSEWDVLMYSKCTFVAVFCPQSNASISTLTEVHRDNWIAITRWTSMRVLQRGAGQRSSFLSTSHAMGHSRERRRFRYIFCAFAPRIWLTWRLGRPYFDHFDASWQRLDTYSHSGGND